MTVGPESKEILDTVIQSLGEVIHERSPLNDFLDLGEEGVLANPGDQGKPAQGGHIEFIGDLGLLQ